MSMSPTVSAIRRSEPAYVHFVQPRTAFSSATKSSASSVATPSCTRWPDCCITEIPRRMFSSVFGPNPLMPARRPSSMASANS